MTFYQYNVSCDRVTVDIMFLTVGLKYVPH